MTLPDDAHPTRGEVAAHSDPLGWRLILGTLVTHVMVASLAEAAEAARLAIESVGPDGDGDAVLSEPQPDQRGQEDDSEEQRQPVIPPHRLHSRTPFIGAAARSR